MAIARFRVDVEDVYRVAGRGIVAAGRVKEGDPVIGPAIMDTACSTVLVYISGVERFRQLFGDMPFTGNVGLVLRGLQVGDVPVGATIRSVDA